MIRRFLIFLFMLAAILAGAFWIWYYVVYDTASWSLSFLVLLGGGCLMYSMLRNPQGAWRVWAATLVAKADAVNWRRASRLALLTLVICCLCLFLGGLVAGTQIRPSATLDPLVMPRSLGEALLLIAVFSFVGAIPLGAACVPGTLLFLRRKDIRSAGRRLFLVMAVTASVLALVSQGNTSISYRLFQLLYWAVWNVLCLALWRTLPDVVFSLGRCQGCGYDLTGNVSGACPECGKAL